MSHKDPEEKRLYQQAWLEELRIRDPVGYRDRKRQHKEASRRRLAAVLSEWRQQGCLLCGEKDPGSLEAHHLDPATKDGNVADLMRRGVGIPRLEAELAKCICLCHMCHSDVHTVMRWGELPRIGHR